MQVNCFVLTLSTLLINRCAAVGLHMKTQQSIAKQRRGKHEGLRLPWRRMPVPRAAGIVRYSYSCTITSDVNMCLKIFTGCPVIIVLTDMMLYAGLAVQMRHAHISLSRAWQQNMHWTRAKQLSALR